MSTPLETIRNSGERAVTVVQDLLTLSRRSAAAFQVVDLHAVVLEYLDSPELKKMLSYNVDVNIETRFSSPPFIISGSKVHLSKTIMNLVTNAAEAMPDGGTISIRMDHCVIQHRQGGKSDLRPDTYIKMSISDTRISSFIY